MKSKKNAAGKPQKSGDSFRVVGIGASAGGLNAFKSLLKAIPEDSGMAYVLVQHLDPTHESMLPEILQKVTDIPVREISNKIKFEPNHIYVMPSNTVLSTKKGALTLTKRPEKHKADKNLPIDVLFTSLSEIYNEFAVGVVLSGTGSDGTFGLKVIKDNGGITFAQDETSAEYDSMPASAILTGVVDFILPADEIPKKLLEIVDVSRTSLDLNKPEPPDNEEVFRQIISLLQVRKGVDFTFYKQTTIRRRILRRLAINKLNNVAEYVDYLRNNKPEQDLLYQDFLIPVTSFFRDSAIFDHLCKTYIPIISDKAASDTIRVWVAGCSTGEEAYSIAICFQDFFNKHDTESTKKRLQIFATDLSEPAIDKARFGVYTEAEIAGIDGKRLSTYFTKKNEHYQVKKQIRDMCVFAVHNFLKDPPFGKMDLISCRNVLIYMEPYLQKRVLSSFHYALNPNGFLFLGKSEATSGVPDLFLPASKNEKIYSRKDVPSKFMNVVSSRSEMDFHQTTIKPKEKIKQTNFLKTADDILLNRYTPAGVIVNEILDIVHFRGKTSDYLEQSSGKPSHNLLVLAKQGLAFELRNILHKAKKEKRDIKKENIPVKISDKQHSIAIEAIPLPNTVEPYYLILFHDRPNKDIVQLTDLAETASESMSKSSADLIKQLEQELLETREDMRSITEDQEAANEELQSANEELMSSSEELQSLNEELETSKEELQSTNEELIVVNHEMVSLNEQIVSERNFSESIVANIREPLLVLDNNLRIRTANNAFYKLFKTSEETVEGTRIFDLANKHWNISELHNLLEQMIPEKSVIIDYELTHTFPGIGEKIILLNAREVISDENSEKLILLSFEDVTEKVNEKRKNLEIQEKHTKELEEKIAERTLELKSANEELLLKNEDLLKMNKDLEAFAYVSSHDLQEPLRKIQTFVGRLLEKESQNLSEKGIQYFDLIQNAAKRMQRLIEDLLEFSRLSTNDQHFESRKISTVVEEVKMNLHDRITEKHAVVEIKKDCEADIIVFQFRQLMQNLFTNAIKFSKPDQSPHIIVESKDADEKQLERLGLSPTKKYCHISVSDNGIGFEKKYDKKIFEVFQKLHAKDEYAGTGIGLATVKKVIDNHHGVIKAKSKVGKGTTFDMYIPYHTSQESPEND